MLRAYCAGVIIKWKRILCCRSQRIVFLQSWSYPIFKSWHWVMTEWGAHFVLTVWVAWWDDGFWSPTIHGGLRSWVSSSRQMHTGWRSRSVHPWPWQMLCHGGVRGSGTRRMKYVDLLFTISLFNAGNQFCDGTWQTTTLCIYRSSWM